MCVAHQQGRDECRVPDCRCRSMEDLEHEGSILLPESPITELLQEVCQRLLGPRGQKCLVQSFSVGKFLVRQFDHYYKITHKL